MKQSASRRRPITYLLTDFPFVSHTFIADELTQLTACGVEVVPIAINIVRNHEEMDEGSKVWAQKTTYLKSTSKLKTVKTFASQVRRTPSILTIPFQLGGFDLKAYVWRLFHLVEAILVVEAMRKAGARHIHAHFGGTPSTIAWFAAQVGNRSDTDEEWTWSMTVHGWHEFANENEAMLRQKVAAVRFVVCISEFTRSQLYRISAVEHWDKLSVVRCGVDLDRFTLRRHHMPASRPRVAMVARVSPEKGHIILLEALAVLRDGLLDIDLDLIGPDGNGFATIVKQRIVDLGLEDRVKVHGPATPARIAEMLERVDVFCLPSFAEGLPVVIMEAMARGVPVVTTFIAGIPELAVDGVTAAVVPAGDVDQLAGALRRVLSDDAFRQQIVAAAANLVREQHDISHNAKQLATLFMAVQTS